MIVIVEPHDYIAFGPALRDMHKLRHRVFKERLGWSVTSVDGQERDEFDRLDPIYLLAMSDGGDVAGAWRMLPTTGPYMLRDVFPHLLEGRQAPTAGDLWEVSRFAVDCPDGADDSLATVNHITSELFCGLIEYCIGRGIREVVTVYDIRIARLLPRIGCRPKWRSGVHQIGNTRALAGFFDIGADVLEAVRAASGIGGSVIWEPLPERRAQAA